VAELMADMQTVFEERDGEKVLNDDQAHFVCRFASGAMGYLFSSRVAHGRKMGYAYELHGSKGTIKFDQEDQNAVWLYTDEGDDRTAGFRKILTGPAHPDYINFCLGPGHGTGYQDQIIIEQRDFLSAIESGQNVWPDFAHGLQVHRLVDAVAKSAAQRQWVKLDWGTKLYDSAQWDCAVGDVDVLINDAAIDAIIICTPTDTHADLIEQAARAGKAIFCEKPIDLNADRVRACLEVVEQSQAKLMVGFNRRFDPHFARGGAVGEVEQVIITSRDPGARW